MPVKNHTALFPPTEKNKICYIYYIYIYIHTLLSQLCAAEFYPLISSIQYNSRLCKFYILPDEGSKSSFRNILLFQQKPEACVSTSRCEYHLSNTPSSPTFTLKYGHYTHVIIHNISTKHWISAVTCSVHKTAKDV